MNKINSGIEYNEKNTNNSKIYKILKYYYGQEYKNFESSEKLKARIVDIDIYIQLEKYTGEREEYKIYIQPIKGLPSIYIKNPGVFFAFCIIHGFLPNINSIIIKNYNRKIDITKYRKFVLIQRMLHLFFVKGFNFVIYDVIKKFLNDPFVKELFKEENIAFLSESEIFSLVKVIEDIKISGFDINKYHFHDQLGKLYNEGTFSENIFLEVAIKYENKIREYLGYDATYIKPASYIDDTKNKIDFNWIFAIDNKTQKYRSIPIQFTVGKDSNNKKLKGIINQLLKSKESEFIYIQIGGDFKKNLKKNVALYKEWIETPQKRELKDPTQFPLFINHEEKVDINELIVTYFYLHQIVKYLKSKTIPKLKINLGQVDFSNISIKRQKREVIKANKKVLQITYSLYEDKNLLGKITYLKKI